MASRQSANAMIKSPMGGSVHFPSSGPLFANIRDFLGLCSFCPGRAFMLRGKPVLGLPHGNTDAPTMINQGRGPTTLYVN